jgi:uncharacterized protein YbcI
MEEPSDLALQQLEQKLAQRVIDLFQNYLGHQPQQVSCKLTEKTLTIVAEDSITRLEQFLAERGRQELAQQIRLSLLKALEPQMKFVLEEVVNVPVVDVIGNSTFDTGRTSIVAVLAAEPELVPPL